MRRGVAGLLFALHAIMLMVMIFGESWPPMRVARAALRPNACAALVIVTMSARHREDQQRCQQTPPTSVPPSPP